MNKKYQVFISSTFSDLIQERQDTIRSVLDLGHISSGMEIFPAADVEQFEYIKKVVDECDYYVLIIGARYGSIDAAGIGFTEKEYDYAVEKKKTVLAFIHGDPGSIPVKKADIDPGLASKLTAFRKKVSTGRLVQFWTSREDLKSKIIVTLAKAFSEFPGVGWVRGDAVASEELLSKINELRNANDRLKADNAELQRQNQANLDGIAGLDELFNVRCRFKVWDQVVWVDSPSGVNADLTWAEIFTAIGPAFMHPTVPDVISPEIVKYLEENKGIKRTSMTVFETDKNTIKLHLMALGLIKSEVGESKGGGILEFLSITPVGHRRLLELLSVRQRGVLPEDASPC
jgi:Domain of unknown function (DUF4062)